MHKTYFPKEFKKSVQPNYRLGCLALNALILSTDTTKLKKKKRYKHIEVWGF